MNILSDKEIVKKIIDTLLDKSEKLNIAWNYGEETIRVSDIIELINNVAEMDYKRPYGSTHVYGVNATIKPSINQKCYWCKSYYYHHDKSQHKKYCIGKQKTCKKYQDIFDYQ